MTPCFLGTQSILLLRLGCQPLFNTFLTLEYHGSYFPTHRQKRNISITEKIPYQIRPSVHQWSVSSFKANFFPSLEELQAYTFKISYRVASSFQLQTSLQSIFKLPIEYLQASTVKLPYRVASSLYHQTSLQSSFKLLLSKFPKEQPQAYTFKLLASTFPSFKLLPLSLSKE